VTDFGAEVLDLYDRQVRPGSGLADGVPTEQDGPVRRVFYPGTGFLAAPPDTGLRGAELDALIARQRDVWALRRESVEWKVYGHDRPEDLPERLMAHGFTPEGEETLLFAEAADLLGQRHGAPGVEVREVDDPEDLRRIADQHTEIWEEDWGWLAQDLADRKAAHPESIFILAAEAGGELVSSAWLVLRPGTDFAGLWGGSTVAAWRGRGIYRDLVARRARIAVERGYRYLQVDASSVSRPILQRLGFTAATTTTPYVWNPADSLGE
jgi:hypothetical protein